MKKSETPAPAKTKAQPKTETQPEPAKDFSAGIPSYFVIQKRLAEPIPPELVFEKERGGKSFPFMNVTDCVDLLDERAGIWQNSVVTERQVGNDFIITVRIEILAAEGWISREDTGIEEINLSSYGDTASNAFAMAFKRAASKHGLGRELWRKHDYFASEPAERAERRRERQNELAGANSNVSSSGAATGNYPPAIKPANPIAVSIGDLLTPKQSGMIFGKAKDLNINAEDFVEKELFCRVDELSRKAASWIIDELSRSAGAPSSANNAPPASNVSNFPTAAANKPENFSDEAANASAGQIKALQVTIDNVLNKAGIDESVVLNEFAAAGCRNVSFTSSGEFMTENLTAERAAALITKFNHFLKHGV